MKFLGFVLLAGACWLIPAVAEARTMALLVGVADYTEQSGIRDLFGPRNDVSMLWRALKQRDVKPEDIAVLSHGLPEAVDFPLAKGAPESANILAELDRLAVEATRGDTVLFYYSGHGTRQPDDPSVPEDEPETDGMDQVLLPSDVGSYDPIKLTIRNAIVDDVLGAKLNAIRAKGALVWAVIDACHSGTVTRGDDVTRSVDPALLGVPAKAEITQSRGGSRAGTITPKRGDGGLVGFYAVESYDEAIERPFTGYALPMVGEGNKQRMGVFTFLLHRALMRNTAHSFRDLAQEIVADLNSDSTGGKVPPPVFDGDLDAAVPGSLGEKLPNAVAGIVSDGGIEIPAGSLHGFDVGARLALFAPGQTEKPVAHADIAEATAVTAKTRTIEWEDGAERVVNGTLLAVVEDPAINFRFAFSPPPQSDFADDAARTLVAEALEQAFAEGASTLGIEMGEAGSPDGDVLLRVKDGRLWIVRPDRPWVEIAGAYDETPSLPIEGNAEKLGAEIKNAVWSLARASKLLRVAAALGEGSGGDDGIVITAKVTRPPDQDARGACATEPPEGAQASALEPLLPVAAGNCDFVEIQVKNESDIDYYVAGFYVDALGGVSAIPASASQRGCVRTLASDPDKPLRFRFWIDTWDEKNGKAGSAGAENFVILAVPKGTARQPPKLCALTQPTLATMQQTREVEDKSSRGERNKLKELLTAVEGASTRGVSAAEDQGPRMSGRLFVFDVKP